MIHRLFLYPLFVWVVLCSYSACANAKPFPECFAGFCVNGNAPSEEAVQSRLGGARQLVVRNIYGYCYRFSGTTKADIYGHFLFRNFGDGWRLTTIRASHEPICTNAHTVTRPMFLSTKEGISLGSEKPEVLRRYGFPRYSLSPPPSSVVDYFFGSSSKIRVDAIEQYVSSDDQETSTARFFISNALVIGIEVSSDE